ncbi:MAG: SusC/RagA family TonB-linked outer membrane protein, partial [Prolixibacteraceae bacterium]|nr:SusC/RagA family TonB-linked outer membrane protein [Prolixibacteraceae bacterium]
GAIYGSIAPKGIVYIRTLKPDKITTTIDFRAMGGTSFSPKNIPLLNSDQFRTYADEIYISGGGEEEFINTIPALAQNPELEDFNRYNNETNWQNEVFNNSVLQDYYLAIRGGDAVAKYGISLGYSDYNGIIKNTNLNRITMRMVGSFNVVKWLKMDLSTSFSLSTNSLKEFGLTTNTSPINSALYKSPFYAPYQFDEDGNKLKFLDEANSDFFKVTNPVALINGFEGVAKTHKLTTTANLEAQLTPELTFKTMIGINLNRKRETKFVPSTGILEVGEIYNFGQAGQNHYNSFYNDNNINFEKEIGNSSILATAGFRAHSNTFEFDLGTGRNMHRSNQIKGIQNGVIGLNSIGGDYGRWNWISSYADINYNINDKYLFNLSASIDGSSRTGKDSDYDLDFLGAHSGIFYSFQTGWRISDEKFLNNLNWLDDLKIRASYGKTGNNDIGNYSSSAYYITKPYRNIIGLVSEIVPNTSLKYEELGELAGGIDVALFGQRLKMNADLYSVQTTDLLLYEALPVWYGVTFMPKNDGTMKTNGWELNVESRLVDRNFKLDIGVNIGAAKSLISEMSVDTLIVDIPGGSKAYIKGQPAGVFFGYETNGIYESDAEAKHDGYVNQVEQPFLGGDVSFVNHSGNDKIINEQDRAIIGDPTPDLFGGFYISTAWRSWSLNTAFQFSLGNDVYNYMRQSTENMSSFRNQSTRVLNRWVANGDITDVPRLAANDPMGNSRFSDRWIEDGSYLRLKNITLNYSVPKPKGINSLDVFVSAQNILTLSKYLGYDPEYAYSTNQLLLGVDYGLMPQSRKILIGIKLGL